MENHFLKFTNREVNCVRADVIIGREQSGQAEYITITPYEHINPLYSFWYKPKHKKKIESPKHTGGKFSYIKSYSSAIKEGLANGVRYELFGACIALSTSIEWNTGYIVVGKGKRRRYANHGDIGRMLNISKPTTTRLLKRLKDAKLIISDNNGYRITGSYFAKGVVLNED